MTESDKPDIPVMTVDGVIYPIANMTEAQNETVKQIHDLEDQLRLNEFKHRQLVHGRLAYVQALKASLEAHDGKPE